MNCDPSLDANAITVPQQQQPAQTPHVWTLRELFMDPRTRTRPPPTVQDVRRLTYELYAEWHQPDKDIPDLFPWCLSMFNLSPHQDNFFESLSKAVTFRVFQVKQLHAHAVQNSMLETDADMSEKIGSIMHAIQNAKDLLFRTAVLYNRMEETRLVSIPDMAEDAENVLNFDTKKNTSFQNTLLFTLTLMQAEKLRKFGNLLYTEVYNKDNQSTFAWKPVCTIKEFMNRHITKEICFPQWREATSPSDNMQRVADNIEEYNHSEVPNLEVNRHLRSFSNGIYSSESDMFFPFHIQDEWDTIASEIQSHRRVTFSPSYVCSPPRPTDVSLMYYDTPFRMEISPETDADFDMTSLPVHDIDTILVTQKLTPETIWWVYAMLGRLFWEGDREREDWQQTFMIKGRGKTGKSVCCQKVRGCFPEEFVSTLDSNIEKMFGLQALWNGGKAMISICAEVRNTNFNLDQGQWQSASSFEQISIPHKNKQAVPVEWKIPFFWTGNQDPPYEDASESVSRRMFTIQFDNPVTNADPRLLKDNQSNYDFFVRKCAVHYLHALNKYASRDIWSPGLLPEQIHTFKRNSKNSLDPMSSFFSSEHVELDPTYEMPFDNLREMYFEFRRKTGLDKIKWREDHYKASFSDHNILLLSGKYFYENCHRTGQYVKGVRPARLESMEEDDVDVLGGNHFSGGEEMVM